MGLRFAGRLLARLSSARRGKREVEEEEAGGLVVRPKPVQHSVRWAPVELPEFDRPADRLRPFDLFVSQPVFRAARRGLTGTGERFGFLYGERFWCPESRSPWVLISQASAPEASLPGRGEERAFRRLCGAAQRQASALGLEVAGWYHEHRYLGTALTTHEVELHRSEFPEPWQCVLIFVSGDAGPSGGFIQPWQGELHFGRALVSFHELTEEEDADSHAQEVPFSTIDWSNYRPERPVQRGERLVLGEDLPQASGSGRSAETEAAAKEPRRTVAEPPTRSSREEGEWSPAVAFRLHSRPLAGRSVREHDPERGPADRHAGSMPERLDVPILLPRSEPSPRERLVAWFRGLVDRI